MLEKLPEDLYWEMAAVDEFSNDVSDGAWWAMLENTVTFWNKDHGTTLDEHETVHAFLARCREERKAAK